MRSILTAVAATLLGIAAVAWVLEPRLLEQADLRLLKGLTATAVIPGILISNFNVAEEWKYDASSSNGGGLVRDDTAPDGTSLRLSTPNDPGAQAWITRSGLTLDVSEEGTFSFLVNISDPQRIESIIVYLKADDSFDSKYFATSLQVRGTLPPGPRIIALNLKEFVAFGGITPKDWITAIQLRLESNIGNAVAAFDSLYYQRRTPPKLVISFDDNWLTEYTEGYVYMSKLGLPGTIYAIRDTVGQDGYMSLKQLKEVYAAGWDIGNHTTDHMGFNSDTESRQPFEPRLRTIARKQTPVDEVYLDGTVAINGTATLNPARGLVFRIETEEQTARSVATVEGVDRFGQQVTEHVPLFSMYEAPWSTSVNEFSSVTHIRLSKPIGNVLVGLTQGPDTTASSLFDCADWLTSNGMPRGAYHVAYPLGESNAIVDRVMQALSFKTGRLVLGRSTPIADGLASRYSIEALAPNRDTKLEEVIHHVDQAILQGTSTHIVFHRLVKDPKVATDWPIADFRTFVDYVAAKRDARLIEPVTISSWYDSLPKTKNRE
jgi:hypothetical protein